MERRVSGDIKPRAGHSWCLAAFAAGLFAFSAVAYPCTTFLLKAGSDSVIGKSYDRGDGTGYLFVNKRGMEKIALLAPGPSRPQTWTSQYGSITFNQIAREMPMGGMNEAGLVVEIMILGETRYPAAKDPRAAVNESQWIQYMLDRFATVAEMLAHAPSIKIAPAADTVHYLACDKTGTCASFEYISGELVTHTQADFPEFVLTNSTAASSLRALSSYRGFGGVRPIPSDMGSISRFVRAAYLARNYDGRDPQDYAYQVLDAVSMGSFSKWNIVYHPEQGKVTFRTAEEPAVKSVKFSSFDFSCGSPVIVHDLETTSQGDLSGDFSAYNESLNRELFRNALNLLPVNIPPDLFEKVVTYPDTMTRCVE